MSKTAKVIPFNKNVSFIDRFASLERKMNLLLEGKKEKKAPKTSNLRAILPGAKLGTYILVAFEETGRAMTNCELISYVWDELGWEGSRNSCYVSLNSALRFLMKQDVVQKSGRGVYERS